MKNLLIRNIGSLVQQRDTPDGPLRNDDLSILPTLSDAWLLVEGQHIKSFGSMADCPERADFIVDATDRMLFPSWVDSHTHLVFAGSREAEFVDRINGLSYEEIARRGGGILNSAQRLQATDEELLYEQALQRIEEVTGFGTGAIEIKSGYGLTVAAELKMLRVIRRLKSSCKLAIKASFLGAHALPVEYKEKREQYIELIIDQMLPQIAEENLADYIDVFCEKNFFSVAETDRILEAGQAYGLKPKIHTNQFNSLGGIQTAVARGAVSVDHLEMMNESEMECLANADTIATLLPSAPFFINDHYPPARRMIDAGLALALASDYNPGSTPSGCMPFVISLACIKLRMLPEEAINAATINGAFALELEEEFGSIAVGKAASFFITKPIPSIAYLPYAFGSNLIEQVYLRGERI